MTSINLNTFALHFGVYPSPTGALSVNGHDDPSVDHEIDLTFGGTSGPVPPGLTAFVSGSWGCWGEADQSEYDEVTHELLEASEGDRSLHVVFNMPDAGVHGAENILLVWDMLRMNIEGRLLDYAVMSDEQDWSEQRGVVLFRGNPFVNILPTDKAVGAVMRNDVLAVLDEDPDGLDQVLNGEAHYEEEEREIVGMDDAGDDEERWMCSNCRDAITFDVSASPQVWVGSDGEVTCPETNRPHGPAVPDEVDENGLEVNEA